MTLKTIDIILLILIAVSLLFKAFLPMFTEHKKHKIIGKLPQKQFRCYFLDIDSHNLGRDICINALHLNHFSTDGRCPNPNNSCPGFLVNADLVQKTLSTSKTITVLNYTADYLFSICGLIEIIHIIIVNLGNSSLVGG